MSQPLHWSNQKCQVRLEKSPPCPGQSRAMKKVKERVSSWPSRSLTNESAQSEMGSGMPKAEGPLTTPLSKTNEARFVPLGFQLGLKEVK